MSSLHVVWCRLVVGIPMYILCIVGQCNAVSVPELSTLEHSFYVFQAGPTTCP